MLGKIEKRSEARRSINAIPTEIPVIEELRLVIAEHAQNQVQTGSASIFERPSKGDYFVHRAHRRILPEIPIVFLDSVHTHLNGEIVTALFMNSGNHIRHDACTVLN